MLPICEHHCSAVSACQACGSSASVALETVPPTETFPENVDGYYSSFVVEVFGIRRDESESTGVLA